MNNNLKISSALQWAWQRSAVVMLCMVLVFFGCKEDKDAQKMDEESFVKSLETAPVDLVNLEQLPEWLIHQIEFYGADGDIQLQLRVFRGFWNRRVIYFLESFWTNCYYCTVFFESGEKIVWIDGGYDFEKFISESKNWTLIYQIEPEYGVYGKSALSNISRLSVKDKYEFPDISHLNDWLSEDIIPRRFKALQIPDNVLANISTAGLLETCLDFPYLISIFHYGNFQEGIEGLQTVFNGFREILKRTDLTF